ncbi:MAG TPA: HD-GYP domain-containing protein [Firmicutes bacterium]|nr:HD-GYP domain-containing protein [Bacillota bacterium]
MLWIVGITGLAFIVVLARKEYRPPGFDLLILSFLMLSNTAAGVNAAHAIFFLTVPLVMPVAHGFGPFWAALVASIGTIEGQQLRFPLPYFVYNRGYVALSAGLSALVLQNTWGRVPVALSFLFAAGTYVAVTSVLYIAIQSLKCFCEGMEDNYLSHAIALLKTVIPSAAFGALFYYLYENYSALGVVAGYILLSAARSQTLFGHIDARYRLNLIKALLRACYSKDPDLMLHLERVAYFSKKIARRYGYSHQKLHFFDEACYLHDIGKLEISDSILKTERKLSSGEYEEIKTHPERGMRFIDDIPVDASFKPMIRNIVLYHHERFDGKGYPRGLSGEMIPLEARIVAVADAWDAMTGRRPYRRPLDRGSAVEELRQNAGTQFDPKIVEVFLDILQNEPDVATEDPAAQEVPGCLRSSSLSAGLC